MGTDISTYIEIRDGDGKWQPSPEYPDAIKEQFKNMYGEGSYFPFTTRNSRVYGFLANVRNFGECPYIMDPRGLPTNSEYFNEVVDVYGSMMSRYSDLVNDGNYFGFGWLTLAELLSCDYSAQFVCTQGGAHVTTVEEYLGEDFFAQLEAMRIFGDPADVRLVFYFD